MKRIFENTVVTAAILLLFAQTWESVTLPAAAITGGLTGIAVGIVRDWITDNR